MTDPVEALAADRCVAVVRSAGIADPAGLAATVRDCGVRLVEITLTVPGALGAVAAAAGVSGVVAGAGTVLTGDQAGAAVAAGARFLVTPANAPEVAAVAAAHRVPLLCGAFTPTEVAAAVGMGAAAVKLFPARLGGPAYLCDLLGPFPGLRLVPSGGVHADNAADFLSAGAFAVSVGGAAVPAAAVEAGDHAAVGAAVGRLVSALGPR